LHKTQIAKPERPDMTDTVLRQDVIDAIEALSPDGLKPKGVGLVANITIKKALAAINAIPAVTVTDDVVQRAIHAYQGHCGDLVFEDSMKVALVAALGE
jgi:hypothetical protein